MLKMKDIYVLGIDIGASHCSLALVSAEGKIFFPELIESKSEEAFLLDRLVLASRKILEKAKQERKKVVGIGIGSPGIVDSEKGIVVVAGNLPELFGAPLRQIFQQEFGLEVQVENDVNALALGEMVFGVAKGQKNFVVFALGTDLGGGIVIDGRLLRGAHFIASEFGHLTLDLEGERCICGGYGCARQWASGGGLAERAREELPGESLVLKLAGGEREKITAREVFQAWKKGDIYAERLIENFGKHLGALIANVMKVLDPEMVVLAGEVCRTEPEILNLVVRWTRHYYFPIPSLPEFRLSQFSKQQAVLGPVAGFLVEKGFLK